MCIKFRRISKNDNMPSGSECTKACARPAGDGKVSKPVTPGRPDAVPPFCIPGPPLSRLHTRGASSLHTWSTGAVTPLVPSFRLLRLPQPAPASGLAPIRGLLPARCVNLPQQLVHCPFDEHSSRLPCPPSRTIRDARLLAWDVRPSSRSPVSCLCAPPSSMSPSTSSGLNLCPSLLLLLTGEGPSRGPAQRPPLHPLHGSNCALGDRSHPRLQLSPAAWELFFTTWFSE